MGKWGTKDIDTNICKVALFISRNKDNKDIENFKQRRFSFLISENRHDYNEYLGEEFARFVNKGVVSETSRFYMSVNTRDLDKVKKRLIHDLIDDESNRMLINPLPYIAGIAALKENALSKHWLFDIDTKDKSIVNAFIKLIPNDVMVLEQIETPNGYHIIVDHGFDTRTILGNNPCDSLFPQIELKRDDMKFVDIKTKM